MRSGETMGAGPILEIICVVNESVADAVALCCQVEVRRADSGEVVYRDMLSCAVSAIVKADYRGDGMQQVVVCGLEGEVSMQAFGVSREHAQGSCNAIGKQGQRHAAGGGVWPGRRGRCADRRWCVASRLEHVKVPSKSAIRLLTSRTSPCRYAFLSTGARLHAHRPQPACPGA